MGFGIRILAYGPRACFTRPEMKAERVSYDVITPSAARGLIESVYWKPAIKWHIDRIKVLNEIKFDTFRRNEVKKKMSYVNARKAMKSGAEVSLNATAEREQRATMYLKNVAYIIDAHFTLTDKAGESDTPEKHYNIALRRFREGKCFIQPVFGCREFPANVKLIEANDVEPASFYQASGTRDLGFMLYDIDFAHDMDPMFFRAVMINGVIDTRFSIEDVVR